MPVVLQLNELCFTRVMDSVIGRMPLMHCTSLFCCSFCISYYCSAVLPFKFGNALAVNSASLCSYLPHASLHWRSEGVNAGSHRERSLQ